VQTPVAFPATINPEESSQSAPPRPNVANFEILEKLGQGGMGVVYKARHTQLNRFVALKMIRAGAWADPEELQRFRTEAQAVAHLQHPGIVQIFEIGEHEQLPYFALEFVEGGSLDRVIAGNAQPARATAEFVQKLAWAMASAHQRGVVHRDLKPANVLLTSDGTPKITDFGLARKLDAPGQTQTGAILGTPSYMAPEQAAGKTGEIGPPCDVYALGAILYEMLTGRPPFKAQTILDTLAQVRAVDPVPPSRLEPSVPRDLETICLKCLRKEPTQRYASAQELAEDLRRFQGGEPIKARPVGVARRFVKWVKRNPVVAALLLAVMLAVVAGTGGIYAEYRNARHHEGVAVQEGETAKRQTRAALNARQRTRNALDRMSSQVIDNWLAQQPVLLPEQKAFLEEMLASYEEFAEETGQEEATRAGVARAFLNVGNIRYRLGQHREAEAAYRRSQEVYAPLVADFPSSAEYRRELAQSHNNLAVLLLETGRIKEAKQGFDDALQMRAKLAAEFPADSRHNWDLAQSHNNLGILRQVLNKPAEGVAAFHDAVTLQKQLVIDNPAASQYRQDLARSYNNLGILLRSTHKVADAERAYRNAVAVQKQLVIEFPTVSQYRQELASSLSNFSMALLPSQAAEAERDSRDALALHKQLVAEYPTVPQYRQRLASGYNNLGVLLKNSGKKVGVEGAHREAVVILKQLVAEFPRSSQYRRDLAISYGNFRDALHAAGKEKEKETEQAYRDEAAVREQLKTEFGIASGNREELALSHNNLGTIVQVTGLSKGAIPAFDDAVAALKEANDALADLTKPGSAWDRLFNDLDDLKNPAAARRRLRDALAQRRQRVADAPNEPACQHELAETLRELAEILSLRPDSQADYRAAKELLQEALIYQQNALKARPQEPAYRLGLRKNLLDLTQIYCALGDHVKAAETTAQLARAAVEPAEDVANVAYSLVRCMQTAEEDAQLPQAQRKELAQTYRQQALTTLRQAVRNGYRDTARLKDDFAPLRDTDEYKKLLADLGER
jgi:tetratricopeptide (TPR) repeat protein